MCSQTLRSLVAKAVLRDGSSSGINRTGKTPQGAKRLRRLTAGPTESVRPERKSTFIGINLLTHRKQRDMIIKVKEITEYSLWYKQELPASHLIDTKSLLTGQHLNDFIVQICTYSYAGRHALMSTRFFIGWTCGVVSFG
ncbi:hypothetical protein BI350_06650 [Sporosarcina ureilytica]|uniref:Uncharacterized protein n=1 Tax=Sporosarcina ureilytica TaxID=298596 RepID=A0A1D8JEW2_9BACL|nr:hypothetical protein BI350_06650 [Sporosarcina ureilytica]